MIAFIGVFILGAFVGFVCASLCCAAGRSEQDMAELLRDEENRRRH